MDDADIGHCFGQPAENVRSPDHAYLHLLDDDGAPAGVDQLLQVGHRRLVFVGEALGEGAQGLGAIGGATRRLGQSDLAPVA